MSTLTALTVPRRFNGPPSSGNGGWVAGALAATLPAQAVGEAVTVTLRLPPPLEVPLPVTPTANGAVLTHDGRTVAEAAYAEQRPTPVPGVPPATAAEAETRYAGHRSHPFPDCFVCGPRRRPDDGLRIFAGSVGPAEPVRPVGPAEPVASRPRVAATWTPYQVGVPVTWAALDCPGGWASDIEERPMVLGRITVEVRALPRTSERYVVTGEVRGQEGRKTLTAATLHGPGDEVVATAEHVWIAVDPGAFP